MADRFVLLIEIGGKQAFIFETAKRREAVGASQLIHEATVDWPQDVLPPGAEIVLAAGGMFLAVFDSKDDAREVLREVTGRAFIDAPGMDVHGVIVRFNSDAAGADGRPSAAEAVATAYREVDVARMSRPHPNSARPIDPFAALCTSSGRPASQLYRPPGSDDPVEPRSAEAVAKLQAAERAVARLASQFAAAGDAGRGEDHWRESLRRASQYLGDEDRPPRVAVVHADGNGISRLFAELDRDQAGTSNQVYLDRYRDLSTALDRAARRAYVAALDSLVAEASADEGRTLAEILAETRTPRGDYAVPALPIVLGGDDLTVVCDARIAIALTRRFMRHLVTEIAGIRSVAGLLEKASGYGEIGVAAGIADVGAHFPFRSAYELAEDLCAESKQIKKQLVDSEGRTVPASAWACHVQLDGSASSLDAIRADQLVDRRPYPVRLTCSPYVNVSAILGEMLSPDAERWRAAHDEDSLISTVENGLNAVADDRLVLPRGQVHRLVDLLGAGVEPADIEWRRLVESARTAGTSEAWDALAGSEGERTLVVSDGIERRVRLADAVALTREHLL